MGRQRMNAGAGRNLRAREFVLDHQLPGGADAGPSVLFGQLRQKEAHRPELAPGVPGNAAVATPRVHVRCNLAFDVASDLLTERSDVGVHPGMLVQAGKGHHFSRCNGRACEVSRNASIPGLSDGGQGLKAPEGSV
jgi:hypothetical protein